MPRLSHLMPMLVAGLLAAPAAMACTQCDDKAATAAPSDTNALTVVRDPETGKLRAATAAELAELAKAAPIAGTTRAGRTVGQITATPLVRRHASGALRSRLTDEFSTYSVITRQPDGKLVQVCVDSAAAAQALVDKSAPVSTARAPQAATE